MTNQPISSESHTPRPATNTVQGRHRSPEPEPEPTETDRLAARLRHAEETGTPAARAIIDTYGLDPIERQLLRALSIPEEAPAIVPPLVRDLDPDTTNQDFLLLLSRLGFRHGWELFSERIAPRLQGLHRYVLAQNGMNVPWLVRRLERLNAVGLPVLLLKGVAMKARYAPEQPRLMGDFDVYVPEGAYPQAMRLLASGDAYERPSNMRHGQVCSRERPATLEVHRWMFKAHNERGIDVWSLTEPVVYRGCRARVPDPYLMLVHLLDNQACNIAFDEALRRRLQWVVDCGSVMADVGTLDFGRLSALARRFHCEDTVHLMLRVMAPSRPDVVPESALDRTFGDVARLDGTVRDIVACRRMISGYRQHRYAYDAALTPIRVAHTLEASAGMYRYLRPVLAETHPEMGFVDFTCALRGASGPADFIRRWRHLRRDAATNPHEAPEQPAGEGQGIG